MTFLHPFRSMKGKWKWRQWSRAGEKPQSLTPEPPNPGNSKKCRENTGDLLFHCEKQNKTKNQFPAGAQQPGSACYHQESFVQDSLKPLQMQEMMALIEATSREEPFSGPVSSQPCPLLTTVGTGRFTSKTKTVHFFLHHLYAGNYKNCDYHKRWFEGASDSASPALNSSSPLMGHSRVQCFTARILGSGSLV
ncbi:uncharacterized protein RBU33_026591 [Hipposideros larvatus]